MRYPSTTRTGYPVCRRTKPTRDRTLALSGTSTGRSLAANCRVAWYSQNLLLRAAERYSLGGRCACVGGARVATTGYTDKSAKLQLRVCILPFSFYWTAAQTRIERVENTSQSSMAGLHGQ
eukprot:423705-Amphidinium_carterae.1